MGAKTTIVVATYNRRQTLERTLARLETLPERVPLIVVDNGSRDGTSGAVRARHPHTGLIVLPRNIGAAARGVGARAAGTPYVAFCDDDCWWEAGSIERAATLLDAHPQVALVNARVLVGPEGRLDEPCRAMEESAIVKRSGCPGSAIAAFMAGAVVVRRSAFLSAGGYNRHYHIGAEESLLSLDLLANGWELIYCPELVLRHYPSPQSRDPDERRRLVLRNRLWTTWLRHSTRCGVAATAELARLGRRDRTARRALLTALLGVPWIVRERRRVPRDIERLVDRITFLPA